MGTIQVLVFPVGSNAPSKKEMPQGIASKVVADIPVHIPKVEGARP
jgi:hypothetical protein